MAYIALHQLAPFPGPNPGDDAMYVLPNSVKGNDMAILGQYNAHDADATLHLGSGSTGRLPAANVTSGTFGSLVPDTGIYSFPSQVGIGAAGEARTALLINAGNAIASSGVARGIAVSAILTASANNDVLHGVFINQSNVPGSFTGLTARRLTINNMSVAAYSSPNDPAMMFVGVLTGTGATNATAISIAPPVGATNNYLIAHTTPATFNVTSAGNGTFGGTLAVTGAATFSSTVQLGVAYVGGAPAATGYLTIKDSTGTTYKILVST